MEELTQEEITLRNSLKQPDILDRKPDLKLCSNHFKTRKNIFRVWMNNGTAKRDGNGWYK